MEKFTHKGIIKGVGGFYKTHKDLLRGTKLYWVTSKGLRFEKETGRQVGERFPKYSLLLDTVEII